MLDVEFFGIQTAILYIMKYMSPFIQWKWHSMFNRDQGADQAYQVDETKYSQDLLHGIGGLMIWVWTKRMKKALQSLILQVEDFRGYIRRFQNKI